MNKMNLDNKVILVTGASSGIGRGCAKVFAEGGAKVLIAARRENNLIELKKEIEEMGGVAEYTLLDVTSEEQCKAAVRVCVEKFGRIDGLLNCAGYGYFPGDFNDEFNTELFEKVIKTNLESVFLMTKYAVPEMEKCGGGSIVNISSIAAIKGHSPIAYTATKGGINAWCKKMGIYFADKNIRVNAICPGIVRAESTLPFMQDEEASKTMCHVQRIGEPEDIGYGALYLLSDAASWVTGQVLVIDGGETCI